MTLHHDKHYASYVSKYNAAISAIANTTNATITPTTPLPVALSLVNSPSLSTSQDLNTAIRNQGGGAWNHALFWKTLSPLGANETRYATAASSSLKRAVDADFAGLDGLRAALAKAAAGVFGSGWAFLCATAPLYGAPGVAAGVAKAGGAATAKPAVAAAIPAPRLAVVTAPNQDSPLTGLAATQTERCIPIAGIDVWEHGKRCSAIAGQPCSSASSRSRQKTHKKQKNSLLPQVPQPAPGLHRRCSRNHRYSQHHRFRRPDQLGGRVGQLRKNRESDRGGGRCGSAGGSWRDRAGLNERRS